MARIGLYLLCSGNDVVADQYVEIVLVGKVEPSLQAPESSAVLIVQRLHIAEIGIEIRKHVAENGRVVSW